MTTDQPASTPRIRFAKGEEESAAPEAHVFVADALQVFPERRLIRWVPDGGVSNPNFPLLVTQSVLSGVCSSVAASLDYEIGADRTKRLTHVVGHESSDVHLSVS